MLDKIATFFSCIGVRNAEKSLKVALIIRACLRSNRVESSGTFLDARLALGIGTLDYESDTLSTSDGDAYRRSGRLLDSMDRSRLEISTPWSDVNDELKLSTAFADDIISGWTRSQSRIVMIAAELGVSRQTVDKSLRLSKEELINAYLARFGELVIKNTKEE